MVYKIELNIKNYATLNVFTTSDKIKDLLVKNCSSILRTIPITNINCSKIDKQEILYNDSIIINNNVVSKEMYYDKHYNVSILNAKEEDIRFMDIVYIALAMFSKILAKNEKYLLHSSALVDDQNNGFLLVGEANSGKTSLAYELMDKHNCKLISNDHSIIGIENGTPMILGGTKEVQMRLGAIELYFPELYRKVPNEEVEDKWSKKIIVNNYIDSNKILPNNKDNTKLNKIYSINTSNSGEAFARKKESIDEFLFLYESMSKIIKGSYNYITGFDYPMPSMENGKLLERLSDLCKEIVNTCDVYDAKGSVEDLARILRKKNE